MKLAIACFFAAMCAIGFAPVRALAQVPTPPWLDDAPKPQPKRPPDKTDRFYWATEGYLAGGTVADAMTTVKGMDHPTMAYTEDGTFLMRYVLAEGGWARCFGSRDPVTASAANVALNGGIAELSRLIYRRGGRWRILAIGIDFAKATSSTIAGVHNARLEAGIDQRVEQATGYRGIILWRSR